MIDIENEVLTTVKTALNGTSKLLAIGENTGNVFPITTMQEIDNNVHTPTRDSGSIENHAEIGYQFDTYTNIKSGKKAQCKAIMATIDTAMAGMGFERISLMPMENPKDNTICRMVSRYGAVVSADKTVYGR